MSTEGRLQSRKQAGRRQVAHQLLRKQTLQQLRHHRQIGDWPVRADIGRIQADLLQKRCDVFRFERRRNRSRGQRPVEQLGAERHQNYYYYYTVGFTCKASPGEATLMHGGGMTVYLYAAVNSSVFNFDLKTPEHRLPPSHNVLQSDHSSTACPVE